MITIYPRTTTSIHTSQGIRSEVHPFDSVGSISCSCKDADSAWSRTPNLERASNLPSRSRPLGVQPPLISTASTNGDFPPSLPGSSFTLVTTTDDAVDPCYHAPITFHPLDINDPARQHAHPYAYPRTSRRLGSPPREHARQLYRRHPRRSRRDRVGSVDHEVDWVGLMASADLNELRFCPLPRTDIHKSKDDVSSILFSPRSPHLDLNSSTR